jgi:DNA repair exonuclease SbcCD ATPase subunit
MSRAAWLLVALLASACAEPPNKEMDQAQGAIDAARAAGADRYATSEYTAATDALKSANTAVSQGDYRLALNYALESREHAQNSAREAADARARMSGEIERSMAEVAGLMAQAGTRLEAARKARAPRRAIDELAAAIARVNEDVQEAGEAVKRDDYVAARAALDGVKERIGKALAAVETPATSQNQRRRK